MDLDEVVPVAPVMMEIKGALIARLDSWRTDIYVVVVITPADRIMACIMDTSKLSAIIKDTGYAEIFIFLFPLAAGAGGLSGGPFG